LEHNQDPTVSAWEQEKRREAKEQEEKEKIERQRADELERALSLNPWSASNSDTRVLHSVGMRFDQELGSNNPIIQDGAASTAVEKELARQMGALTAAEHRRTKQGNRSEGKAQKEENGVGDSDFLGVDYDDDDDDELDRDEDPPANMSVGSSRYQTDFVELGVLGRGGGGEVVKVRNRLDRRICK
jgi:hypothetical protein